MGARLAIMSVQVHFALSYEHYILPLQDEKLHMLAFTGIGCLAK